MAYKAESNIVTAHGTIANGESFNPDTYKMPKEEVERLISIGVVSRGKSETERAAQEKAKAAEKTSREKVPVPSKADTSAERTPDPSTEA